METLKTDYKTGLPITAGLVGSKYDAIVDKDCKYYSTSICNCLGCVKSMMHAFDLNGKTPWEQYKVGKELFPNWDLFPRGPAKTTDVVSAVATAMAPLGGSKCKKCQCVNEHAAPNQKDGSYICYCCR